MAAQDPFGNYVVQYVLELGHAEATSAIMTQLCGHYPELAQQKFSSNVVEKCLKLGGPALADMRERVINELIDSPLIPRLLQARAHAPHTTPYKSKPAKLLSLGTGGIVILLWPPAGYGVLLKCRTCATPRLVARLCLCACEAADDVSSRADVGPGHLSLSAQL